MTVTYYAKNFKGSAIDSPFAKMLPYFNATSNILGIPPSPIDADFNPSPMYGRAAELLQLNGPDVEFVANRVRHLDFAARNSSLSDRITWKSSSLDAWNDCAIYNQPYGISFNFNNSALKITGTVKLLEVFGPNLNWIFLVSAEGDQVTIRDNKDYYEVHTVPSGTVKAVSLSDSGYSIYLSNSLSAQQTATGTITVKWPYIGDIAEIKNRVINATDFVTQLIDGQSDLAKYFDSYAFPEDTIAATLIALDSI